MEADPTDQAWNNFVLRSDPTSAPPDRSKRAAAVAALYMGAANNGGINSFLTSTYELASQEVLDALVEMGATVAARELEAILKALGEPLLASSAEVRWDALGRLWKPELNDLDVLSYEADAELMRVLEQHVQANEAYYAALGDDGL